MDRTLVERAIQGDEDAYAGLMAIAGDRLLAAARCRAGSTVPDLMPVPLGMTHDALGNLYVVGITLDDKPSTLVRFRDHGRLTTTIARTAGATHRPFRRGCRDTQAVTAGQQDRFDGS